VIGNLSSRERTLVLAGGGVLIVVLAWLFVIAPLRDRTRSAAELVPERERALTRRLDLLARRNFIATELEAANARVDLVSARATTEIRSERILPPEERGELLEIPVEIAVSAEIRQLVDLLARVEGSQKLLTVKDLRVRVVNVSQPRELLATLTVSGFILPSKAKT
jgi:type II secretory pathway component PulM